MAKKDSMGRSLNVKKAERAAYREDKTQSKGRGLMTAKETQKDPKKMAVVKATMAGKKVLPKPPKKELDKGPAKSGKPVSKRAAKKVDKSRVKNAGVAVGIAKAANRLEAKGNTKNANPSKSKRAYQAIAADKFKSRSIPESKTGNESSLDFEGPKKALPSTGRTSAEAMETMSKSQLSVRGNRKALKSGMKAGKKAVRKAFKATANESKRNSKLSKKLWRD